MDLLINTYGTRIRSSGERIVLCFPNKKTKKEYPIRRIEKIIILRPSSISMHAVQLALEHDVDIVYLGSFGKPLGRIFSSVPRGMAQLRKAQLEVSSNYNSFDLAKQFVMGKTKSQIAFLKFLSKKYNVSFEREIIQSEAMVDSISVISRQAKNKEQLLGMEGYVADKYFKSLQKLYKFPGRNPQGRDRFNSALNYGYGILYNEVERACLFRGLDPYLGLYHTERYGKPALVLDLVEEFRVPIVDSVVFLLFLEKDFSEVINFEKQSSGGYQLSVDGKRKIVEAIFLRLNQVVSWHGKRRKIKAVIDFQVLILSQYFLKKKKGYIPFNYDTVLKDI